MALAGGALAEGHAPKAAPKSANVLSPDQALARLLAGNARFATGKSACRDFAGEREVLTHGQNPYVAILSCADSRVALDHAFDEGLGDIFACRVAGNVADDDVIASFEYAIAHLGTPLIVVLGHTGCGAVTAAVETVTTGAAPPGHLPGLVNQIAPAVKAAQGMPGDLLANSIRANVAQTAAKVKDAGPILSAAVAQGKLRVVGGVYNLADGRVTMVA
jgi:carbonic anhydrase